MNDSELLSMEHNLSFDPGGMLEEIAQSSSPNALRLVSAARAISSHPVFPLLSSVQAVREYMSFHIWCVWDFMTLAKAIQLSVGRYSLPWIPPKNAQLVRLANQILIDEEADLAPDGTTKSHFEIYLMAMQQAQVPQDSILSFVHRLGEQTEVRKALTESGVSEATREFVLSTMTEADADPISIASAFCFGREELLPFLNRSIYHYLPQDDTLALFRWYIERHVILDCTAHGPIAANLLRALLKQDPGRIDSAIDVGIAAIASRSRYLDAIKHHIISRCNFGSKDRQHQH